MVVWLVFGRGKAAAGLEVVELGALNDMLDEAVEVGRAAFKEGLELHDTGVEGGGVDATDDAEVFDLGEEVMELGRCNLGIGSFPAAAFAPAII